MWREQLYSVAETPQPPSSPPPHLDSYTSYTRALLVSQDRRHLLVTPWCYCFHQLSSQCFTGGHLGSFLAGMEDWTIRKERGATLQSAESGGALATPSESARFQQCCDISSCFCVVSCISVPLYLYSLHISHFFCVYPVFAYTATKIPFMYSFSGNSAASAPISTFMCLWAIHIVPGSVYIFPPAEKADRSWEFINRAQSMNVEIGTETPIFLFWEYTCICFEISVFCLCSVHISLFA